MEMGKGVFPQLRAKKMDSKHSSFNLASSTIINMSTEPNDLEIPADFIRIIDGLDFSWQFPA